ncbi:zinc finger protein 76-like isoform X2 [Physella acuta]|uniref:zinc finger protein 76-like isoform X2 n=1 Tax=Physella acuta TaxID=109671 RepID=UPI0027DD3CFF|nr:zinc finger protein 76-like isoform X2 [Physella acuta]
MAKETISNCAQQSMDNVLDSLGESSSLSPLSSNVHDHDEDFTGLGDHTGGGMEETNLNSDGDDEDEDHVNIVSTSMTADDDDPIGLGVSGGHDSEDMQHDVDGLGSKSEYEDMVHSETLEEDNAQEDNLDENGDSNAENQLAEDGELKEGILLTDGNLAVPVSADHVIRLLMHTSDGNVVTANASVEAIKFSMANVITSEGGELTQTVLTLSDGTTTLIKTEEGSDQQCIPKFEEGQTIKLEDGTTALLRSASKEVYEGLQEIHFEDGSTAFITRSSSDGIFADTTGLDGASLNLDQLTSQTMMIKPVEKAVLLGDKAYKCMYEDCGRLYTTHHHLKVHERSHTGDRPFQCDFPNCNKRFATGYGLKSHNRVHTGEKPYACPHTDKGCEKAFKTSGDLQKHVRTHTGERPFKCPFEGCNQSFTTSNIRKVHIRTHTGERPYICDMEGCGRAFASATNYKNHIRIHTGEKPYVCGFLGCSKRFTEYSSLYKHNVVHTHSKPYTCHCGKTYRQTSTLAMHKRTAHGEETPQGLLVTSTETDSDEPPSKKMLIKSELSQEDEGMGQNLIVSDGDTSVGDKVQMMLLTSGVGTGDATTFVTSDGSHQVASLVTLQTPSGITLQDLQQSGITGLTSLSLGENGQQVLVVTDPAQLEALQQLAAQHLESLTHSSDVMAQLQGTGQGGEVMDGTETADLAVPLSQ